MFRTLVIAYLNVLVHVVVDVLACHRWVGSGSVLCVMADRGVLELRSLLGETLLVAGVVVVVDVTGLNGGSLVVVLLWKGLLVVHWLHGGVVVVLVDFLVYS